MLIQEKLQSELKAEVDCSLVISNLVQRLRGEHRRDEEHSSRTSFILAQSFPCAFPPMQFNITYLYRVDKTALTQFSSLSATSQEQVRISDVWMQLLIASQLGRVTGHPKINRRLNKKTSYRLFVTHLNVFPVVTRHKSPQWKAGFMQYYVVTQDRMWPRCIFLPLGFAQQ